MSWNDIRRFEFPDLLEGARPVLSGIAVRLCCVDMHVVENGITGNESSLLGKPEHGVFVRVSLDLLEDFNSGVLKFYEVNVVFADRTDMGGRARSQNLFPFLYFLWVGFF